MEQFVEPITTQASTSSNRSSLHSDVTLCAFIFVDYTVVPTLQSVWSKTVCTVLESNLTSVNTGPTCKHDIFILNNICVAHSKEKGQF